MDIHGCPREVTWTELYDTADIGATTITMDIELDWAEGEEIVIASTDYESLHSEVRTITAASTSNGQTTLSFNEPLEYRHFAGALSLDGSLGCIGCPTA